MVVNKKKVKNGISCFLNYLKFKYWGIQVGCHFRGIGKIILKLDAERRRIVIGDNCIIVGGGFRNSISRNMMSCIQVQAGAELLVGNDVRMSDVCIWARKEIVIGNFVTIGADTIIMDSDSHPLDWSLRRRECVDYENTKKAIKHKAILIGDDVFIGARCIINKGVTIGARTIIAAGSVVVSDIPSDVVAGGNPCRVLRSI